MRAWCGLRSCRGGWRFLVASSYLRRSGLAYWQRLGCLSCRPRCCIIKNNIDFSAFFRSRPLVKTVSLAGRYEKHLKLSNESSLLFAHVTNYLPVTGTSSSAIILWPAPLQTIILRLARPSRKGSRSRKFASSPSIPRRASVLQRR